jgi:predicted acyltransferase
MSTTQALTAPGQSPESHANPDTGLPAGRLLCLDIFRGLLVAGMILVDNGDDKSYWAIKHAEWNGWTPADFIFPSFLFLVGVSMVFSYAARLQRGESRAHILWHASERSLLLIAIGLFVNGFPFIGIDWHSFRFEGVTQRIALCYFAAAILVLWSNHRGQIIAIAACLLGYWAVLRFVPVPGFGTPGRDVPFMDANGNIAAWLDRKLFMGHLYNGNRDPEGIIHTIPAVATTLIGVLTGSWLRSGRDRGTIALRMLFFGILGLVTGEVWNIWFPINKNLWTSSFVAFAGGFSLVVLAFLYWVLEIKQWRGTWTMPILVFGMNAIAGFVADSFVYGPGYSWSVKGANGATILLHDAAQARLDALIADPANAALLFSVASVLFCWVLLWLLWRKRVFLKV